MPTIKDVAKRAKVAKSTVSYVLNNTKTVTPETYERIITAIDELGYTPRVAAQSLKTKRSLTIGVIIPDITNNFFIEIIKGIEDITYSNGYNIILCNTQEDQEREKHYLENLFSKDIDGIIFISTGKNESLINKNKHIPIITVDRRITKSGCVVSLDNVKGGYMATKYLMDHYGNNIHLITGPLTINTYFDRMTGYINAYKELGIDYDPSRIVQCDISVNDGMNAMISLLNENREIKSIFVSADIIALGVLKALLRSDKKVGKDVFLIGYDDIDTSSIVSPALTTIPAAQI